MSQGSGYQKVKSYENKSRMLKGPRPRKNFDENGGVICKGCFEHKVEADRLKEEIKALKIRIYQYEKTTKKDVSNAHTPSSKINYKENSKEDVILKKGGAVLGHKGHGRKKADIRASDRVIDIEYPKSCEECNCKLNSKDVRERTVIESVPLIAQKIVYRCKRGICPKCFQIYPTQPPALAKSLYGNSLISQAAVMHYVHGITMGKVLNILGANVGLGGLVDCFHRLGKIAEKAKPNLIEEYRNSLVKHADETGWRTDGRSGYAWIFCNPQVSIFEFRNTRGSRIPYEIMGYNKLPGVLVVDRYGGYNGMHVEKQYCYAHLLREVEKLEEEFREDKRVVDFSIRLGRALSSSMKLRGLDISEEEYLKEAEKIKEQIESLIYSRQTHLGIIRIQEIFIDKRDRLYHWVKSRDVPADNNLAERELRPTVIARKVSFGSQSDAGAKTRSSIMTLLYTVKKRLKDKSLEEWLKNALDQIAADPDLNIFTLIPASSSTPSN